FSASAPFPGENRLMLQDASSLLSYDLHSAATVRYRIAGMGSVFPLSFEVSPDHRHILMQNAQTVSVYDLATGKAAYSETPIADSVWLPDSIHLIVERFPQTRQVSQVIWF